MTQLISGIMELVVMMIDLIMFMDEWIHWYFCVVIWVCWKL